MAEQNSEDTRNPATPRRGARPFIGPAGAPGQRPAPLRAPVAGARPARGPFVPAPLPPGRTLGTVRPEATIDPAAVAPAASLPATPDQASAMPALPVVEPSADATDWWAAGDVAEAPATSSERDTGESAAGVPAVEMPSADVFSGSGLSNERFAAFDAGWHDVVPDGPVASDPPAPSLDVATLGSATANEQTWAEDIAAEDTVAPATDVNTPAWLLDDVEPASVRETPSAESCGEAALELVPEASTPAPTADAAFDTSGLSVDGTWTENVILPSAESLVADGVADSDVDAAMPSAAASTMETPAFETPASETRPSDIRPIDTWPDQLLAEYAPYVPTPVVPSLTGADLTDGPAPVEAKTEGTAEASASNAFDAEPAGPGLRVSAALNRLADRIRDGEIDVSSIAPDASDAAVLASLLAALLGGGSSSSR